MRDIPSELVDVLETLLNEPVKPNSDARIAELRRNFRRAYAPWSPEEDILLLQLQESGFGVSDLMATLCRQEGAIRSRLDKLVGERGGAVGAVSAPPIPPTLKLQAQAEQFATQFELWLQAVKQGGQVDIVQGGEVVARLVKP